MWLQADSPPSRPPPPCASSVPAGHPNTLGSVQRPSLLGAGTEPCAPAGNAQTDHKDTDSPFRRAHSTCSDTDSQVVPLGTP